VFEDCTIPAAWCQWAHDGEGFVHTKTTSIDGLAPVCGYHHRIIDNQGWILRRSNGRMWCIPPTYVDPEQKPRCNEHIRPLRE
jgi:hypothetical protein